jgi:hypothetical protein
MAGKNNIAFGLIFMAGFMAYGFLLIYLRDFAPDKEQWIAQYSTGKHFESRLAHVHGNLFAFLNILIGYLLLKFPLRDNIKRNISWIALSGMLMPLGILAEVYFGVSPIFVLLGALAIIVAVSWLGFEVFKLKTI